MTVAVEEGRLPRLGRGAEQELERLYASHADDVRRYVRMVLRNRDDAEDVVQQTFLKALRALQAGVRPQKPRPWLVAIAHNECRMIFRRASRRPVEVELEEAAAAGPVEDGQVSATAIRDALGHLSANQRTALVMRELDDRTYGEIAAALGVSESAVETLLFRARRALREQLEVAGGCDEAQALIAADELDELARRRLRAHTRTCRACATLERRRRGRLAAAARTLAGLFPTPSWLPSLLAGGGAKAVVAVAAAGAVAAGAVTATEPAGKAPEVAVARLPAAAPVRAVVRAAPAAAPARSAAEPRAKHARTRQRPVRRPVATASPAPPPALPAEPAAAADPPAAAEAPSPEPGAAKPEPGATHPAGEPAPGGAPPAAAAPPRHEAQPARLPPLPALPPPPTLEPPQPPALPPTPTLPEPPPLPPVPQLPPPPPAPPVQPPLAPAVQPPPLPTPTTSLPSLTNS